MQLRRAFDKVWSAAALGMATGCGLGYSPVAPGTVGSLAGPPLVWGWQQFQLPLAASAVAAALLFLLGVAVCDRSSRQMGMKDPGCIVYDEIWAFVIVFAFVEITWVSAIVGFLWFRLFDVTKPFPIKRFESMPGGWGVMVDDLIAAIYAAGALWLTQRYV